MIATVLASMVCGNGVPDFLQRVWRNLVYNPLYRTAVKLSFEQALVEVWRQVLIEGADVVELGAKRFPARQTPKSGLRQVDFEFDGAKFRGLEQNPKTKSRWAQLARSGKKVMQFLSEGRYVANVVDGEATLYGKRT